MEYTKLTHLSKETMLSKWQNEQSKVPNTHMFLSVQHPEDPWAKEKKTNKIIEMQIPALRNTQWASKFRSNKDMNQEISNKRIQLAKKMFE
jgi:hypothetical protein